MYGFQPAVAGGAATGAPDGEDDYAASAGDRASLATSREGVPAGKQKSAVPLNLTSALFGTHPGNCRPCAWFWKEKSCKNEQDCSYCHLCPKGELKSRKKSKLQLMRIGALTPANDAGAAHILKLNSLLTQ